MSARCPTCQATYGDDAKFCPRDGTKLESAAHPSASPMTPPFIPPAPSSPLPSSPPPLSTHARVFQPLGAENRATSQRSGASGAPAGKSPDHSKLVGETLDSRYAITRKVGEGGMSFVYLADDLLRKEQVAIKILSPSLSQDRTAMARLRREAELGGKLAHPNVCHIIRLGETLNGLVYVVMPYVQGELLCDVTNRAQQLPLPLTARFITDIAAGLQVAHELGIVHRDLKPENIMISKNPDGSERAIVMDFGIAVAMQTSATSRDGRVMGNAHYVSPEQAAGEPLDARSDLYSLGVVGFYALTGRLPFDGETSAEVVAQHLGRLAPDITSVAASVPPRLANAVQRCLHKDPIRRYRNAESFAEAIDLAFEHAKEIPAPLRVWLSQGERELPARIAVLGIGAMAGVTTVYETSIGWMFLVPFVPLTIVSFVPGYFRLRRVLADGYVVDDLHAAMREHQLARSEEIEYERRQGSPWFRRAMRVMLGISYGGTAIGAWMYWKILKLYELPGVPALSLWDAEAGAVGVLFTSLSALTFAGVALGGEYVRLRLASRLASMTIAFWKGRWGARLARLSSIGLKKAARPAIGMPLLTEVALGRATDHLFEALPKTARQELAGLPDAVRRLESDAGKLRQSIDALDTQLAMFERGGDALNDAERTRVAEELRGARALAAERLAATVSALENIRLDLLRLQMGSAGIESVTASLEAARHIGQQIADSLGAQAEVERLLRHTTASLVRRDAHGSGRADDDANTPASGVPATRG
jgi:eukaryotic-like serine/threonine-protein kinase